MKYLLLPQKLIIFWYVEGLLFFIKVWKNSISFLEEDLAVFLMLKLLFVPLFHDSTIFGRIMSFCFRSIRIVLGLFAFALATLLILSASLIWFSLPVLVVLLRGDFKLLSVGLLIFGMIIFLYQLIAHPEKKLWQIKKAEDLWLCSNFGRTSLELGSFLKDRKIQQFLLYLEKTPQDLALLTSQLDQNLVLEKTWEIAKNLKLKYLEKQDFFVGLILSTPGIETALLKINLKPNDFLEVLDFLKKKESFSRFVWLWDEDFQVRHLKGTNRGWLGVPTPNLDLVSEDITKKAAGEKIEDFNGREDVVSKVINTLSLETNRNVIIVGDAGAGKSSLVNYLAKLIISGNAPSSLATKRLVRLDLTKLLSGVTSQGELADRVNKIFEEIKFSGNIILFVDEIHELGMGEVGSSFNLYSLIQPFIESSDFQFIGTTETSNYTHILEKNPPFARLFTKVELYPATPKQALEILKNKAIEEEFAHKKRTSIIALNELVGMASKYIKDRVMPDSVLQVYVQCLSLTEDNWITKITVDKALQTQVSVPIGEVGEKQTATLLNLENEIHLKLIDQVEAVSAVAKTLRRSAANLRDEGRPIGSFLFVGPTGVGKTELAKILADIYFQKRGQFFRFDMSEYQNEDSVNKLIGGFGEGGELTEEVRRSPYCLILLDEFEKAHPKILTLFLQVLDDGRLTDGDGKTIDFTNTIIIATSNAASLTILKGLESGISYDEISKKVTEELLRTFKPELVNRFDEVVIFKPLSNQDLQKIVLLKLAALQNQLKSQGFLVEFSPELVMDLAKKGFDPVLGARPLRRLIQDTVEARLSVMILENKLPKGETFLAGENVLGG